jgi:ABC-type lipoprotein release transport system permease subunit
MSEQQIYSVIHNETGHIQINQPGFLLNHDMQIQVKNADSLLMFLHSKAAVAAASAIIQIPAMASTASGSSGIMVNGIQPSDQQKVSDIPKMLIEGDYFKSDGNNEVVIGHQLAAKLKVKLHSRIVLTLQTVAGDIIYGAFKVTGIFRTHNSDFDKQMIFVRQKDIRQLTGFQTGAASIITILLRNTSDIKQVVASLQKQFPNLQVQSYIQLSPMIEVLSGTMMQVTLIFVGIILIALAFGIINTMLMAVLDRTREIGMLLSIGMKPSKVFGMIMLETIFLSLTGAVIGVLVSIGTIWWFGKTGINLSIIAEGFNALGYSSIVYPTLGINFYFILVIMVIVIAMIAGIFPARRAIQLKPAEALRGD